VQRAQDAPLFDMSLPLPRLMAQQDLGLQQGLVHGSCVLTFVIGCVARFQESAGSVLAVPPASSFS
jgi:hypothetical protein